MSRVRPALAFTAVVLRSLARDRAAIFFMLVLPVVIMTIIGATFGGASRYPVGLVERGTGQVAAAVVAQLGDAEALDLRAYADEDDLAADVRRGRLAAGVVVPAGLDEAVGAGRTGEVALVATPASQLGLTARIAVQAALDRAEAPLAAIRLVVAETGATVGQAAAAVEAVRGSGATVAFEDVGGGTTQELSRFSLVAPQNLVLFVFINGMASAGLLVLARRAGVLRRALATRTPSSTILVGLGIGWLVIALVQSALILAVGRLLFGVRWGDPLAAALLVLAFALVGASAGLLVGALGKDVDRVTSITPILGIVLGALGGCMVPLEIFPPGMRAVAHVTPHFWAIDAWQALVYDGAGVGAIATSLLVLLAFAGVLLAAATWGLRRALLRG